MFKVMMGLATAAAVTATAAPKYPFPQSMKNPNGTTIQYADTKMIQEHFNKWKKAWYKDKGNEAWVLAPEGTGSTVSEAIAYGMLIMVYMSDNQNDYKNEFDKLYATWTNNGGKGGGMNWRIGTNGGSGSATDADVDAAMALIMASKQWGVDSYLEDAKTIIKWIGANDFNGNQLKPGNQWNDAFNPSYATLGHFTLFGKVVNDAATWETHRSDVAKDLLACQDSKTGLVPDWCSWGSHQPTKTQASVAQSEDAGFFDDAARTPWRTAWAYYWYGDKDAKTFNEKITKWLIPATRTASGINSGYYVNGEAEKSTKRNFVSSTFSGGLGLATSSVDSKDAETYMSTVYKALSSMTSCEVAEGCGDGQVSGERYYPATLNLLYLLLMTGNMPNLYDVSGFEKFTADPSKAPSVSQVDGDAEHLEFGDTTVAVSGFWNWGAYHDKLGLGTKMVPDSGASPLYRKADGIYAEASMEIGPEPEWTQAKKDVCDATPEKCELKYPSAGIAMSFKKDECKATNDCGVNLKELGVKYLRIVQKVSGPIRMAVLNTKTVQEGAEPGTFVNASGDYTECLYDMTPEDYGFKGFTDESSVFGGLLDWVDRNEAPTGDEIVTSVKGLKWEVKDAKGGIGEISIKSVEFLDANKQVIDPSKFTGMVIVEAPKSSSSEVQPGSSASEAIQSILKVASFSVRAHGQVLQIENAKVGSDYAVFSMQGKVLSVGKVNGSSFNLLVPNAGSYLVRIGSEMSRVNVK